MAYLLDRPLYVFWNFSIIAPDFLPVEKIARIQKAALQVLESEEDGYLKSYFSIPKPIVERDLEQLDSIISELNQKRLDVASLEASQRKLELIEKSFSLRLGRFLTYPLRILSIFKK